MGKVELFKPPREVRVNTKYFYSFYNTFLDKLKEFLPGVPRWITSEHFFPDGTPNLQIIPYLGTTKDIDRLSLPYETVFIPFWYLPSNPDSGQEIEKIGNAITHVQSERTIPLAIKRIGVCPYAMLRKDQDSVDPTTGQRKIGEAIYSEIFSNKIDPYFTDLLLLSPHSKKAVQEIKVPYLSLTAIPLFVDWFKKKYPTEEDRKKVKIAALDEGGLQGVLKFVELAGLDSKTQIIVFDKKRNEEKLVNGGRLRYGNPKDSDVIVLDDVVDTSKSADKTFKLLKKGGAKNITLMVTHGVLSFPAGDILKSAIDKEIINNIVLTNSLPQAQYGLEELGKYIEIIDIAPLMAGMARFVSAYSIKEIKKSLTKKNYPLSNLSPYIMEPRDKQEVWQEFINKVKTLSKSK
mgnify:CR=1 FL=1